MRAAAQQQRGLTGLRGCPPVLPGLLKARRGLAAPVLPGSKQRSRQRLAVRAIHIEESWILGGSAVAALAVPAAISLARSWR